MEKRTFTHNLAAIQAAMTDRLTLRRTWAAARDAEAVLAVIQALRYPTDFDKSATAHHNPRQWHDSYKPKGGDWTLYLKFTVDETGAFLLTSFKEA